MMAVDQAAAPARGAARPEAALSIVVPVFNEAIGLPRFHERLVEAVRELRRTRGLGCEVIYVDDGSRDDTLTVLGKLPAEALDVQIVSLSRNFGKEAALMAGLDCARFGAVLFMDGDGQHPPDLLPRLVGHWLDDGYDVVFTAKAHRANESLPRRLRRQGFLCADQLGRAPEDSRSTPAISGCCRRAPPTRCGGCPNATASSRVWQAGSAFVSCASTTSRPSASMAGRTGT